MRLAATVAGWLGVSAGVLGCAYSPEAMRIQYGKISPSSYAAHAVESEDNLEAAMDSIFHMCAMGDEYSVPYFEALGKLAPPAPYMKGLTPRHVTRAPDREMAMLERCKLSGYRAFAKTWLAPARPPPNLLQAAMRRDEAGFTVVALERGAIPTSRDLATLYDDRHVTHEAKTSPFFLRRTEIAKIFAGRGVDLGPALMAAARRCSPDHVRALIEVGAKPTTFQQTCRDQQDEPEKYEAVVRALLGAGADPKTICVVGSDALVDTLLRAGADPNWRRPGETCWRGSDTALDWAASNGKGGIGARLFRAGGTPTPNFVWFALNVASRDAKFDPFLHSVLDKAPSLTADQLRLAIDARKDIAAHKILTRLPQLPAEPQGTLRDTWLHVAARQGSQLVVAELLKNNPPLDRPNKLAELPLDCADASKNVETIQLLERAGARRADPAAIALAKRAFEDEALRQKAEQQARDAEERAEAERRRERREQREEEERRRERAEREQREVDADRRAALERRRREESSGSSAPRSNAFNEMLGRVGSYTPPMPPSRPSGGGGSSSGASATTGSGGAASAAAERRAADERREREEAERRREARRQEEARAEERRRQEEARLANERVARCTYDSGAATRRCEGSCQSHLDKKCEFPETEAERRADPKKSLVNRDDLARAREMKRALCEGQKKGAYSKCISECVRDDQARFFASKPECKGASPSSSRGVSH